MKTITERGFYDYGSFVDDYKSEVIVRQSSSAEKDAVWIFVRGGQVKDNKGSIHLDTQLAIKLVSMLTEWIADVTDMKECDEKE